MCGCGHLYSSSHQPSRIYPMQCHWSISDHYSKFSQPLWALYFIVSCHVCLGFVCVSPPCRPAWRSLIFEVDMEKHNWRFFGSCVLVRVRHCISFPGLLMGIWRVWSCHWYLFVYWIREISIYENFKIVWKCQVLLVNIFYSNSQNVYCSVVWKPSNL